MSWELFQAEQDPEYPMGLRWWYHVQLREQEKLVASLESQFPGFRVHVEDCWGPGPVIRAVWPFRFEVRFGQMDGAIIFRHRACVAPEQQTQDRASFENTLISALLGERARLGA